LLDICGDTRDSSILFAQSLFIEKSMLQPVKRLAFFAVMLCMLGVPFIYLEASQFDYDISVQGSPISFSSSKLYLGETTRIYGTASNLGNKDVSGYVGFYQGTTAIGEPQFFSSKASGASEDFWIDWTPTIAGTYNVALRVIKAEPLDQNSSNDTMVSRMITVTDKTAPTPPPSPSPTPVAADDTPTQNPVPTAKTSPKTATSSSTRAGTTTTIGAPQNTPAQSGPPVVTPDNGALSVPSLIDSTHGAEVAEAQIVEPIPAPEPVVTTTEAPSPLSSSTMYVIMLVGGVLLALLFFLIGAWLLKKSRQASERE